MSSEFPTSDMELTHILVVSDLQRSKDFYENVLGADIYKEYGGSSCVLKFQGAWLLIVTEGGPTKDKPDTNFTAPNDIDSVSHSMTIRVDNCKESYELLKARGAVFLTPPVDWGSELRCFFRDPDGHLFEISQLLNQ